MAGECDSEMAVRARAVHITLSYLCLHHGVKSLGCFVLDVICVIKSNKINSSFLMSLMVQAKQGTALPCVMKVKNDEQCEVLMKPLEFSLCDGGSEFLQYGRGSTLNIWLSQ